jgi:hypothetical protein
MVLQTRTVGPEDITRKIMQQGEMSRFDGNMTGNLGIIHEIFYV